jgi:hypothetical protein
MKIDRVILALNNNPIYTRFWNISANVWKNKFNITPTLIFNGTESEFNSNNFNTSLGEYIIIDKINEASESNPDWSVTWSLFWGASRFPNDVCMLSGIDQVPIGYYFYEQLNYIDDDKFVVGFGDAYKTYTKNTLGYFNTQTNVLYPSSHLVGKGNKFEEIYGIEDEWKDEVVKVYKNRGRYHLSYRGANSKSWGLDECYSSEMISLFPKKDDIVYLNIFWDYFQKNRIDLSGNINSNYNLDLIKSGGYSEVTCKDFSLNQGKLNSIIDNIPKYF